MKERALSMAYKLAYVEALKVAKKPFFARFLYIQIIQEF
jgi:hypothetical protein